MRETGCRLIIYKVIMAHIIFICISALSAFAEEIKQLGEVPILGQPCAGGTHTTIDECAEKWCCKANEGCSSNAECREARSRFFCHACRKELQSVYTTSVAARASRLDAQLFLSEHLLRYALSRS